MKDSWQRIEIPPLTLIWSHFIPWDDLKLDSRSDPRAVNVPAEPGVYEVYRTNDEEDAPALHIGKTSNLRMRIKQGLVKGKVPHSTGKRIRKSEDTSILIVHWAVTDRPAAVEEELHRAHIEFHGDFPIYTKVT